MRYDVTYLLADRECTDRVEAHDAALAVAAVEVLRGRQPDRFELLAVSLLDCPAAAVRGGTDSGAAGVGGSEVR